MIGFTGYCLGGWGRKKKTFYANEGKVQTGTNFKTERTEPFYPFMNFPQIP